MSHDELSLDLPPRKEKVTRKPEAKSRTTFSSYTAANRRFCDICMGEAEYIKGVPRNALSRATHTEDGPDGRKWLCAKHKAERSALVESDSAMSREVKRRSKKK